MPPGMRSGALRVVIVDDHPITRAASRALLRTEGVEVLADLAADGRAVTTIGELAPDVVVIDLSPGGRHGLDIARLVEALPCAPRVVLTSSAAPAAFGALLDGIPLLAKADVCAQALVARWESIGHDR